jgi:transcriptional regulator with XRE-family HTH domain
MSVHEDPLLARKRLRISVRQWRESRELTQKQVADALEWSVSKVVRIESGAVRVSTTDLRALLALYQVSEETEVARLVDLARAARRPGWYRKYENALDRDFAEYLSYESSAETIATFQPLLVPGLLQTQDYARAVFTVNRSSHVEERLWLRRERQAMLGRDDGPFLQCVIDEAALHRRVGGPAVMREQLIRLGEAIGPRISLGIIPFTAGAHPSMMEPFTILRLGTGEEDILFREAATRTVTDREDHDLVAGYLRRFERLREMSVEGDRARMLIDTVIQGLPDPAQAGRPA